MKNQVAIQLSQNIPFGILQFKLSDEEEAILKLIACEKEEAIKHWKQLWKQTIKYEDLLFSCKELMPLAIKKIQTSCNVDEWQLFIPKHAEFLTGLPRYTWTKNQYIISEYQKIAAALDNQNIEYIAIKGVCEMLDGSSLALMRTSRDIDILIHEDNFERCRQLFENLGWIKTNQISKIHYLNSPIKAHAETFHNAKRIFELDVHFAAIPGAKSAPQAFTKNLWKRKVKAKNHPHFYIPSLEDRYIIAVANVFNLHNWLNGHTTKYICDILTYSTQIEAEQLLKITADAEKLIKCGDFIRQAASLVTIINGNVFEKVHKKYRVIIPVKQKSIIHIMRFLTLIQLLNMLIKPNQVLHVLTYSASRVFLKIFNRLKRNLFVNSTRSTETNLPISQHSNRFSIHIFPH
ncbi:MAG: nucleotidyltransferase family protein [Bacteroidota bacterium]